MRKGPLVLIGLLIVGLAAWAMLTTTGPGRADDAVVPAPVADVAPEGVGGVIPEEPSEGPHVKPSEEPSEEPPAPAIAEGSGTLEERVEAALERARALAAAGTPEAEAEAREIYEHILERFDRDQREARLALGYTDFQLDVLGRLLEPGEEAIPDIASSRRDYTFLHEVEALDRKRWLNDEKEIAHARAAVAAMREHVRRLQEDSVYRLGDQARANVAMDAQLGPYNYETLWSPPFLLCRTGRARVTEYDLRVDWAHAEAKRAELLASRARHRKPLETHARLLQQLYAEFLRRYGERHDLKGLAELHGGRPDLGDYNSYPDGVPLFVWTFEDLSTFVEYHSLLLGQRLPMVFGGYFSGRTSWVWLYDVGDEPGTRERETRLRLRLGTYQLVHWFTRQRNKWRQPPFAQEFFGDGLAGYLSSVEIGEDGTLAFTGSNAELLADAHRCAEQQKKAGDTYPLFPLRILSAVTSYRDAEEHGRTAWGTSRVASLSRFREQSWMFIHFLHHHEGGKYLETFHRLLEAQLTRENGLGSWVATMERGFGLDSPAKWAALEAEFHRYIREDLLPEQDG